MKSCSQWKINYQAQLIKEKEKNKKLSNEFDEAKSEVKRLRTQLDKMNQRQAKTILYYDTLISDLQALNQEYRKKIDSFQLMKERSKKMNVSQSKSLNRSFVGNQMFKSSFERYKQQDKQNVNFLNQPEAICCQKGRCASKIELNKSRILLQEIIKELHDLSYTINYRSKHPEKIEQYNIWAKRLQEEQNKRKKKLMNTSPIQILKYIQETINIIREKAESNENNPTKSTTIFEAIANIKSKQKSLLEVPFLEKIQLQELKQDTSCFIQSANEIKGSILSRLRKQINI